MEYIIEFTDEFITGRAGLALVGQLLSKTKLNERINGVALPKSKNPEITHAENMFSMIALLCMGKPDFEAIEEYRRDSFFADASPEDRNG